MKLKAPDAFHELFQRRDLRTQIWHGGRGGGKSYAIALYLVLRATEEPMRVLACREIQKSIDKSSKQLIENTIRKLNLSVAQGGPWDLKRGKTENKKNGSDFIYEGLRTNIDSIRSIEGIKVAWPEEAANVSPESWRVLGPTVRLEGSQIVASLNRKLTTDHLDREYIQRKPSELPPRTIVRKVNWRDNPWFPQVLREEMEWMKQRDYDRYLHVWEGEPMRRSDTAVFKRLFIEDIDDQIPENLMPVFGADWGMTNPTCLVKMYIWPEHRIIYVARTAYKIGATVDETPALFAGDAPRDHNGNLRWENRHAHPGIKGAYSFPIRADSNWPGYIRFLRDRGFNITKALKGPRSVEEGVDFLLTYDIYIHPDCEEAIYEFQTYSYKTDKDNEDIVLSELEDKDNHVIDAARYAAEEYRRSLRGTQFVPRPPLVFTGSARRYG